MNQSKTLFHIGVLALIIMFTLCCIIVMGAGKEDASPQGLAAAGVLSFATYCVVMYLAHNYVRKAQNRIKEQNLSIDDMLRLSNEEYEKALESANQRSAFLSNMSHEIRTPINAVLGMNEMIIRESDDSQIRNYARNVASSGSMLLALVNDILDFSKIDSGKLEIVAVQYYIQSTINDLVAMIQPRAESKNLEFKLDISPDIPAVLYGDDVRIRQIILNLLTNAVKYTHEGSITLSIQCYCADNFCKLFVSVADTGIGIKDEDVGSLTDQFTRVDEQKNRNIEGTGLGLSIVSNLLDIMGSSLEVCSTYGEGSIFSFVLEQKIVDFTPIGEFVLSFEQGGTGDQYEALFTAPDAKILVVDDNSMNREVFIALLKETEVEIDEAEGGRRCLEMIREKKYDVIFLDHMMPEMDGIETLHAMKENRFHYNQDTPVVALTANAVTGAREEYLREGFDAFLSKPVVPEKLERMIAEMLPPEKLKPVANGTEGRRKSSGGAGHSQVDLENMPSVEGLDWSVAALHLPGHQLMMDSVRNFSRSIDHQADILENQLNAVIAAAGPEMNAESCRAELDAFRIQVHAMKSSANIIGLFPLGGTAAMLEYGSRDGRLDSVIAVGPHFIRDWRSYKDKLSVCFDQTEAAEKEAANQEEYADALRQLIEAVEAFDVHLADEIMEWLRKYSLPDSLKKSFETLEAAVADLDGDLCQTAALEIAAGLA